jgi:tRNA(Met) cytidine acetyltransferase
VYRGERRPQGHLLAQALTYHCGIEHAATLDYARVMRIAVHPELQQQGIGTQLLDYIVSYERSRGCDAIGTSFGMNKLLLDFWKQAGFDLVRIGFTREQTSGEHAAIMLLPLSHKGVVINLEAARRFNNQISYWLNDVLKDLPDEIKHEFPGSVNKDLTLTTEDKKDLQSFLNTTRNYELCIAALNKLVMKEINVLEQNDYPRELSFILKQKVINNVGWKELSCAAGLTGKEEARALFKKAVMSLVQRTIHL